MFQIDIFNKAAHFFRYICMAELATVYVARAPRYILSPEDNRLMFFAHKDTRGEKQESLFLNISATGLAFATERDLAPNLGEMIKLEFSAPGEGRVAWWGRVVRVEEYEKHSFWSLGSSNVSDDMVYVAVKFQNMPEAHVHKIKSSVKKKFKEIRRAQKANFWNNLMYYVAAHQVQIFMYVLCIIFSVFILFALAQPSGTYDKDRGSPWGLRFKQFQHDYLKLPK